MAQALTNPELTFTKTSQNYEYFQKILEQFLMSLIKNDHQRAQFLLKKPKFSQWLEALTADLHFQPAVGISTPRSRLSYATLLETQIYYIRTFGKRWHPLSTFLHMPLQIAQ